MTARIRSLSVGLPQPPTRGKGIVQSGIVKLPALVPVVLDITGLRGDGQSGSQESWRSG